METYLQQYTKYITERLDKAGRKAMEAVEAAKSYNNDTYNMKDSFGYGVYVNGRIARKGYIGSPSAHEGRKYKGVVYEGREEVDNFLSTYNPDRGAFAELVVVASMPYARHLEAKRRVSLINGVNMELSRACTSMGVSRFKLHVIQDGKRTR